MPKEKIKANNDNRYIVILKLNNNPASLTEKKEKNCDKGTNPSDGGGDGEVPKYKR